MTKPFALFAIMRRTSLFFSLFLSLLSVSLTSFLSLLSVSLTSFLVLSSPSPLAHLPPSVLLVAATGNECDIRDLLSSGIDLLLAPNCSAKTPHNAYCNTTESACISSSQVMVRQHVCLDGEWRWPRQPQFCQPWNTCEFVWPDELRCRGPFLGEPSQRPTRMPSLVDPGLKRVTVTHLGLTVFHDLTHAELARGGAPEPEP